VCAARVQEPVNARNRPTSQSILGRCRQLLDTGSVVRREGVDRPAACAGTGNVLQEMERAMRDVFGPFFFAEDIVRSVPTLDMLCKYGVPQIIGCGIVCHCSFLTGWSPS
jgi:hypothetical protein